MRIKAEPREVIYKAVARAIKYAKKFNGEVYLIFNETDIRVYPQSYQEDIVEKYWMLHKIKNGD